MINDKLCDARELEARLDELAETISKGIGDIVQPRLAALEEQDAGVWKEGASYAKGTAVTRAGSLWIAQRDYPAIPGTGDDNGWRLAAKGKRVKR